ncbi:hypothetical protein GYMLUDRAFT_198300 [Collybiopsis luxurians FD-317 M1]|uniref:Uncharacterized protein n=1 Tax=Collybiopsis luxurians FD-317 M1 TaxID=944289 RepID=A0A0D0D0L4_9AGAR|nr:hypothetical protein GYMLUDRAFT_198300 [Collybiopsis luxurians FD-317 M1]
MIILSLLLRWLATAKAGQLVTQNADADFNIESWSLDVHPSPNNTANFIFNTVHSLLTGWPGRRYRNGHTIVPGILPAGTLLYHGRGDPHVPETPEWTALDSELSTLYCGLFSEDHQGCWHLTLVAERSLKVLYFDGYSGLKFPGGTIDSQDVVAWGKIEPDNYSEEPRRISDLCNWGKQFGIDGFVRLHTSYEVMLCNFSAGLRVDSILHLKMPYVPQPANSSFQGPPIRPPPKMEVGIPLDAFGLEEILASKRIDEYPGEVRIQLDLHRLVSFYDISLAPSLVSTRFGQHRLRHRILGISQEDIIAAKERIADELAAEKWTGLVSGIDWPSWFHTLVQRYADRLELLYLDLNSTDCAEDISPIMRRIFVQLRGMLQPYNLFSVQPKIKSNHEKFWAEPVYRTCAKAYPPFVSAQATFTPAEWLMFSSLSTVNGEICRVITKMWADGVEYDLENTQTHDMPSLLRVHTQWKQDLDALMSWLDWTEWLKCAPACNFDEMCYLPISPYRVPGADPAEDWIIQARDPRPTCVSKHSR